MAIVKTLDILLRGRTEKLKQDLEKSKSDLKMWANDAKDLFKGLFAGITFAAITAKFRQVFNELDALGDRSDVFGIAAEDLGNLERAAGLAGVSIEGLAAANKFLLLNISKAGSGVKQNVKLFEMLGLSADKLSRATAPERFVMIANSFSKIESQAKKTELAMKLFGKQGLLLLPLLSQSADDLQKTFAQSQRLGLLFSRAEIETMARANDSMATLGQTFSAVFGQIGVQVAPLIELISNHLAEAIKPGTALNGVMRGLGDLLAGVLMQLNLVVTAVRLFSEVVGSSLGRVVGWAVGLLAVYKVAKLLIGAYKLLINTQKILLVLETARAALSSVTVRQAFIAVGVVTAMTGAFVALDNTVKAAMNDMANLNDEMMQNVDLGKQMRAINVASAERGSQAALEQLFTVRVPVENEQVKLQREGNAILGAIRDGVNGLDNAGFDDIEEQGAF